MSIIDDIKDRLDLVTYVGRDVELARESNHMMGDCPFHLEKSASFKVWDDHYHCFGCGAHGDIFTYVEKTRNVTFGDVLRELAREAGVALRDDPEATKKRQEHLTRTAILRTVATYYHDLLTDENDALAYLHGRGFRDDFLASYLIGWTPGHCVRGSGIADADLKKVGLLNGTGRDVFWNRVVFPVWGRYDDEIVDLDARVLTDAKPKYLKLGGDGGLLNARGLRGQKVIYLAEGDTDTATLVQEGYPVVGVRGVHGLTDDLVEQFAHVETVYICADSDVPKVRADGTVEEPRGLDLVRRAGAVFGNRARIVTIPAVVLPNGTLTKDVNDYVLGAGQNLRTLAAEAPPFIEWMMRRLPERVSLDDIDVHVKAFAPALKGLGKGAQEAYSKKLAKALGITLGPIREELRTNGTNGHVKHLDATRILWQDTPLINPAQALVDGTMLTTVFLDKLVVDEETEKPKVVTVPHVITSRHEVFELSEAEMFGRGYRYAATKVPALGVLGQRWRTGAEYPHSVKNYVDGAVTVAPWDVYSDVVGYFRRHLWYPNPLYYDFLALWTIGSYFFDLFPAYPYVHLLGTKRCGKTLTLDIIAHLAFNAISASSLTGAAAFRTVEMCSASLLLDEAENLVKRDKSEDTDTDKLEILKAGYKKGGRAIRCTGDNHEPTGYDVYSPKMFGGTSAIDRVLGDRVIALTLARKDKAATLDEFSLSQYSAALRLTRDKLYVLMLDQGKEIAERFVDGMHWSGVTDRDRELWTPILLLAAFFDDYYVEEVGRDQVKPDDLLTARMRALAGQNVVERQARDRLDQVEVTILEAILEYLDGDARPVVEEWYAVDPLLAFLQKRDELAWLKSMRHVYNELEKTTAINKSQHLARKRPGGASSKEKQVRCVWLSRPRIEEVAKRLGALGPETKAGPL